MARGWESKSVEQQQEEAQRAPAEPAPTLTAAERDRLQRREQLTLALALTQDELQKACHPRHRDMLRLRLDALRAQITKLSAPA